MKRAENFQAPSSSQAAAGVTYNPSCHASNGPIGVQYDPNSYVPLPLISLTYRSPQQLERDFNTTGKNIGLPYATDLTCGNPAGLGPIANTRSGNLRIDACKSPLSSWTRLIIRPRIPIPKVPTQSYQYVPPLISVRLYSSQSCPELPSERPFYRPAPHQEQQESSSEISPARPTPQTLDEKSSSLLEVSRPQSSFNNPVSVQPPYFQLLVLPRGWTCRLE